MVKKFLLILLLFGSLQGEEKSVFIAVLARNKAHVLPTYLKCLEDFDYDKKQLTLYFNTNNNVDATEEILRSWVEAHMSEYAKIIFEEHAVENLTSTDPHAWTEERLSTLALIREKSLRLAEEEGRDYYFVADCDTFLAPCTLRELVKKELPIVAPMVESIPTNLNSYSNFFAAVNAVGLWQSDPFYYTFFNRERVGTVEMPLVHITYLIRNDALPQVTYINDDPTRFEYEFQTFAHSARENGVKQYVCNEKEFGTTLRIPGGEEMSLEEEASIVNDLIEKNLAPYFSNYPFFTTYYQENIFCSFLTSALEQPKEKRLELLWEAHAMHPERAEPIYHIVECYEEMGERTKAYHCLLNYPNVAVPEHALSGMKWVEEYGLLFKRSLIAYFEGKYQDSLLACDALLAQENLPPHFRAQVEANRTFPVARLCHEPPTTDDEALLPDKTVLMAILARNKAHVLPMYLRCLENFEYDKKNITLYINTNDNRDETQHILEAWAEVHQGEYARIIFEEHTADAERTTNPHVWPNHRLGTLAAIRNKSLRLTKELGCDFYFVADCDTFLAPCTLKELVKKELPIVAPMIKSMPENCDLYSNYYFAINEEGYWIDNPNYYPFFHRDVLGTVKVPLVHITYLVRGDVIDKLTYENETGDYGHEWEFMVFARSARENHVDQFICNEKEFGTTLHFFNMREITLEEEAVAVSELAEHHLDQYFDNFPKFFQAKLIGTQ